MRDGQTYQRFSLFQRLEHWIMVISFVTLAGTGLPQRYSLSPWAETLIGWMGGIETVRVVHRVAATLFIAITIAHVIELAYKVLVLRVRFSILPGLRDVTDLLATIAYNLGLTRQPPRLPRFTFAEKIEYWALVWGSVLMIITGAMLWNPIATTRFLPGEFIPAAKMAHSAEALLAALAVLIWHVYFVHLRTFNKSMFTGHLTRHEMEEEHAAELQEIESGLIRLPVAKDIRRRRERIFLPVAAVATLVAIVGLYFFVTMEQTAIATVPPAEQVQAFVPATPTPTRTPTATATPTPSPVPSVTPAGSERVDAGATPTFETATLLNLLVIPHALEGRQDCLMCHSQTSAVPYPPDHVGRPSSTCLVCHATTRAEVHLPVGVKHDLTGRDNCLQCHPTDVQPASHKTAAFSNKDCLLCHVQATPGPSSGEPGR